MSKEAGWLYIQYTQCTRSSLFTCMISGSGDQRLERGVECLSGDCEPWEGQGRGSDEGRGSAHLLTIIHKEYDIYA